MAKTADVVELLFLSDYLSLDKGSSPERKVTKEARQVLYPCNS